MDYERSWLERVGREVLCVAECDGTLTAPDGTKRKHDYVDFHAMPGSVTSSAAAELLRHKCGHPDCDGTMRCGHSCEPKKKGRR